jgi:hypothetical protein
MRSPWAVASASLKKVEKANAALALTKEGVKEIIASTM